MTSFTLPELRAILRQNALKGYSHYDKKQLVMLLREKELLPNGYTEKEVDPKLEKMRTIRSNPRPVVMTNIETGEEHTFPSIYKAARFINQPPGLITFWNGRVYNKHEIRIGNAVSS